MSQLRALVFAVPATYASTRDAEAAAWRHAVGVASALGWPHAPTEADVVRVGGGIHVPIEKLERWVYWSRPRVVESGRLAGSVVLLLDAASPALVSLDKRALTVPAKYDGADVAGVGDVTVDFAASVAVTRDHDGAEAADPVRDTKPLADGKTVR